MVAMAFHPLHHPPPPRRRKRFFFNIINMHNSIHVVLRIPMIDYARVEVVVVVLEEQHPIHPPPPNPDRGHDLNQHPHPSDHPHRPKH
jgi:hypothetical protein